MILSTLYSLSLMGTIIFNIIMNFPSVTEDGFKTWKNTLKTHGLFFAFYLNTIFQ